MRLASLAMYVNPPPVAEATRRLWHFLHDLLRAEGLGGVPETLDETIRYDEAWLHPDLLLAQTCGYPYVRHLRGRVRLVATPAYGLAGCDGPLKCSFIVVRRDNPATTLAAIRGSRAAINEPGSNSGVNLFRAAIAPLARGGRFFEEVVETGGHGASLDAVASGRADVAAIDCVTYGNMLHFDPDRLANIKVLAETAKSPGLPLITRAAASDAELAALRRALAAAIAAPTLASVRDTLSLTGFTVLEDDDYDLLAQMEETARHLGYPAIA